MKKTTLFFCSLLLSCLLLVILSTCSKRSPSSSAHIFNKLTDLTRLTCPEQLATSLSRWEREAVCFTYRPATSGEGRHLTPPPPLQLIGVYIAPSTAAHNIKKIPLFLIPDGGDTKSDLWQGSPRGTQRSHTMEVLEHLLGTLAWDGALWAFSAATTKKSTLGKPWTCGQASTAYLQSETHPAKRGVAYQNFFTSCLTELTKKYPRGTWHPLSYSSDALAESLSHLLRQISTEHIQLLAFSSATRAALGLIARDQGKIKQAVLENIYPPGFHPIDDLPVTLGSLFTRLEDACQANRVCARKFSQTLLPSLTMTLEALAEKPMLSGKNELSSPNVQDLETMLREIPRYYIDAHAYLNAVLSFFSSREKISQLPALIEASSRNITSTLPWIVPQKTSSPSSLQEAKSELMRTFFASLWLCNDRLSRKDIFSRKYIFSKKLPLPKNIDSLAPSFRIALQLSGLSDVLQDIIIEEWTDSPCAVYPNFEQRKEFMSVRPKLTPPSATITSDIPIWVLNGELHPSFSPALTKHPSLSLTKLQSISFSAESSDVLLRNVCASTLVKKLLTHTALSPTATLRQMQKEFPCLTHITKQVLPFVTKLP